MKKRTLLKIGLDVDDVLYLCNQHAIDLLSQEKKINGLDLYDINSWGVSNINPILDQRIAYFSDPNFVANQPLIEGAQDFVSKLCKKGEVFFVTAVGKDCMNERARRLIKDFPEVPERNIIIGARKDLVRLDILLDDGAHNIIGSNAEYPVLFRRPWNNNLTGLLAVNSFSDFLVLIDQIIGRTETAKQSFADGGLICLVGPSGSKKSELSRLFEKKDMRFVRPSTTTTRAKRTNVEERYNFVSKKEFEKGIKEGKFLEYTVYGGNYYGCQAEKIKETTDAGKIAVMPIDICGAIALKNVFKEKCLIVFTDRSRRAVLRSVLNMQCNEDEKMLRILSLDSEFKNKEVSDLVVNMDLGCESAFEEICTYLNL